MYKHYMTLVDKTQHTVIANASVKITDASTGLNATLYKDDETTIITNPITNGAGADVYDTTSGLVGFKVANGIYDIEITVGSNVVTLTDIGMQESTLKNNLSAVTSPTVNDDSADGYSVGSLWIDTLADEAYRCLDNTLAAAVWVKTTLSIDELGTMALQDANAVAITGGTAEGLAKLKVAAGSAGNVARHVMTTALGGVAAADGANTWCKLFSFKVADTDANSRAMLLIDNINAGAGCSAIVDVNLIASGGSYSTTYSKVDVLSIANNELIALTNTSFKLIGDSSAYNNTVELWMKKTIDYCEFSVVELLASANTEAELPVYNDGAIWQAATPAGAALNITSGWSGKSVASTSFTSSWVGNIEYRKYADGWVEGRIQISTVGTTTDGTTIFTMPAGFIRGGTYDIVFPLISSFASNGGATGRLIFGSGGTIKIYSYLTGGAAYWTCAFSYQAG